MILPRRVILMHSGCVCPLSRKSDTLFGHCGHRENTQFMLMVANALWIDYITKNFQENSPNDAEGNQ